MNEQSFELKTLHLNVMFSEHELRSRYKHYWCDDKRLPEVALNRFIQANKTSFDYLGIVAKCCEIDVLSVSTTQYCGVAPLFSPKYGNVFAEVHVLGRFGEHWGDFLAIEQIDNEVEFNESLRLVRPDSSSLRPPIAFLCAQFLSSFLSFDYKSWRKFSTEIKYERVPCHGTQWEKYAIDSIDPSRALIYPNKKNFLFSYHNEFKQLLYVVDFSIKQLEAPGASYKLKRAFADKFPYLRSLISLHGVSRVTCFRLSAKDSPRIRNLKLLANRVLAHQSPNMFAWRFDCAKIFELYVQVIFRRFANSYRFSVRQNPKYSIHGGRRVSWGLSYLEPDLVLDNGSMVIVADAKYKAHLCNVTTSSSTLKDSFRADFHQLLAYLSLFPHKHRLGILVYPMPVKTSNEIYEDNPVKTYSFFIESACCDVMLIGIPVDYGNINKYVSQLFNAIRGCINCS